MDERLMSGEESRNDEESSLRPQSLEEYIGQKDLKENLYVLSGGKTAKRSTGSCFALWTSRFR